MILSNCLGSFLSVFGQKNKLKNRFLDKIKYRTCFSTVIVAGIWGMIDDASSNFFLKR
jgi:hypothetical protein